MNADELRDYILGFIFHKYLVEKMEMYANTDNVVQEKSSAFAVRIVKVYLAKLTISYKRSTGNALLDKIIDRYRIHKQRSKRELSC